ncbi:MAG: hypothetical protein RSC65_02405 [Malacoplasma sp.]
MAVKVSDSVIANFKTRIIFPFYIDNIHEIFFSNFEYKSKRAFDKLFPKLKENMEIDEINKIYESYNLTTPSSIQKILNHSINKISMVTSNLDDDIFYSKSTDKFNNKIYVDEKNDVNDFNIIGNIDSTRRYNYSLNLRKEGRLFRLVEQIQFSFYLDEKSHMMSGAVSFNWGKLSSLSFDFAQGHQKTYLMHLLRVFIKDELKYLSLNNIIDLIDENSFNEKNISTNNRNKNVDTKKANSKFNFSSLKSNWIKFINSKFLCFKKFSKSEITYFENELFFSILTLLTISLIVYEDLKIYFRSQTPELILSLIEKEKINIEKKNPNASSSEELFLNLIGFVKDIYFNSEKIKINEIKSAEDAIKALIKFNNIEKESFALPIISYELIRNDQSPFLYQREDIFLNNTQFKILFLSILDPELFGLNDSQYNLIEYDEYEELINSLRVNSDLNEIIKKTIYKYSCEWNFDYVSFINESLSFLLIKNNNINLAKNNDSIIDYDYGVNKKIFNNYLWAQIFTQTRIWKIKYLEEKLYEYKNSQPFLLRKYLRKLDALYFDWNDTFYGIPGIIIIIKKINSITNLKNTITTLSSKFNLADEIYGKSKERRYLGLALMTASLFGFADFFSMIFTVLTVPDASLGINNISIIFISLGTILTMFIFMILFVTIFKMVSEKTRSKKNNGEE